MSRASVVHPRKLTPIETGVQFHLPTHKDLSIGELLTLAQLAEDGGIGQLWVTDNLQNRNLFVVLAALATNTDVNLGTAVMVHYFRNPVVAAGAIATITELMGGSRMSIGVGRGNIRTSNLVKRPRPLAMMDETARSLRVLLDGGEVRAEDFPALSDYFNYAVDARFRLNMTPSIPISIYCGGDGPKTLAIGGRTMDGLLLGTTFRPIDKMGHLPRLLRIFDQAADEAARPTPRRRVAEVKISLNRSRDASREFASKGVGSRVLGLRWRGFSDEDISGLGITPDQVDGLEQARERVGGTSQALAPLVTDEMIDAFFIAGSLEECRTQVAELVATAEEHDVQQILFSGISEDFKEGLSLLMEEIVPHM